MKKTAIMSIRPYLNKSIPIGVGTTAICFLMSDKRVLKLFMDTYGKQCLFECYSNIIDHFEQISTIKNDTYVTPEEILIKDNKCIGYIYEYTPYRTFKRIKFSTKIDDIINKYDKLLNDTKEISFKKFKIQDLHDRNILYGDTFKIIDLDRGNFEQGLTKEEIFRSNMVNINKTIINSLLHKQIYDKIEFNNINLKELYKEYVIRDYKNMSLFLKELQKYESDIDTVGKMKIYSNRLATSHGDYYRHYL